jgi:hypothetical protein
MQIRQYKTPSVSQLRAQFFASLIKQLLTITWISLQPEELRRTLMGQHVHRVILSQ